LVFAVKSVDDPISAVPHAPQSTASSPLARVLTRASFAAGCVGLLLAMAVDATSVLGRHLGLPVRGSIELMRACVVVFASSALVGTTLSRGHASVHMLTERIPVIARRRLQRVTELASAVFFAVLAIGSLIVVSDLWSGDETTELLQLPLLPLRLLWCASACLIVFLFTAAALSRRGAGRD
jgi:TRAP-type C4-dicarboxylate transport system permease small subunit